MMPLLWLGLLFLVILVTYGALATAGTSGGFSEKAKEAVKVTLWITPALLVLGAISQAFCPDCEF